VTAVWFPHTLTDWVGVTQVAAQVALVIAAFVGIWTVFEQRKISKANSTVALLKQLDDEWQSAKMLRARAGLATALLTPDGDPEKGWDLQTVMNFFENCGFLVKKGLLDDEAIWNAHSEIAVLYWEELQDEISKVRQHDQSYWENYKTLYERLDKIGQKRKVERLSRKARGAVLRFESSLTDIVPIEAVGSSQQPEDERVAPCKQEPQAQQESDGKIPAVPLGDTKTAGKKGFDEPAANLSDSGRKRKW
jgi:hypothetical protein